MNEIEGGRRSSWREWNFYPNPEELTAAMSPGRGEAEAYSSSSNSSETPWKSLGAASMNAISFGFVATAILVSMFLIIAILEHLFRPSNLSSSSSQHGIEGGLESGKLGSHGVVMRPNASGLSVVMPGQKFPTCIAQPAPLIPFPREGVPWPPHHQHMLSFSHINS